MTTRVIHIRCNIQTHISYNYIHGPWDGSRCHGVSEGIFILIELLLQQYQLQHRTQKQQQ